MSWTRDDLKELREIQAQLKAVRDRAGTLTEKHIDTPGGSLMAEADGVMTTAIEAIEVSLQADKQQRAESRAFVKALKPYVTEETKDHV